MSTNLFLYIYVDNILGLIEKKSYKGYTIIILNIFFDESKSYKSLKELCQKFFFQNICTQIYFSY